MDEDRAAFEIRKILAESDIKHRNGLADVMKVIVATSTVMVTIIVSLWGKSELAAFGGSISNWLVPLSLISLMVAILLGVYHIYYALAYIEKMFQQSVINALSKSTSAVEALKSLNTPTIENTWLYKKSALIVLFLFATAVTAIAVSPFFSPNP